MPCEQCALVKPGTIVFFMSTYVYMLLCIQLVIPPLGEPTCPALRTATHKRRSAYDSGCSCLKEYANKALQVAEDFPSAESMYIYIYIYRGHIGTMEKKMETTIL